MSDVVPLLLADISDMKMIALFLFLGIWLFVAIRLLFTRKETYDKTARIPLDDQQVMEPRTDPNQGRADV